MTKLGCEPDPSPPMGTRARAGQYLAAGAARHAVPRLGRARLTPLHKIMVMFENFKIL